MPDWRPEVRGRLARLRLSPAREADIVEEFSQHLDDRWHELKSAGVTDDEATRMALGDFETSDALAHRLAGLSDARWKEPLSPGVRTGRVLQDLWNDLRYAVRVLVKHPGFSVAAILTLALGIGAVAAIFTVVNSVLLKPLPFEDADRLVNILHRGADGRVYTQGPDTYLHYRETQRAFEDIGIWDRSFVTITAGGPPDYVEALNVSSSTLSVLRVRPEAGGLFTREDDRPNGARRAILTHGYWSTRFGGAAVIGTSITIDGESVEIVGILPPTFRFPQRNPALLLPFPVEPVNGVSFDFQVLGRLKAETSLDDANADLARMIPGLHPSFADLELQPHVISLIGQVTGSARTVLWVLFGAVVVVLLAACSNVANLFLVRVEARQRELAVRSALGAGRGRIARVLLVESVLVSLAGGALGLGVAAFLVSLLRAKAPASLPRLDEIAVDWTVVLFVVAVSVISGAAFATLSLLRLGRDVAGELKAGGRSSSDGPARHRARSALVVTEIALAVLLLVASGLMLRTFDAIMRVGPGFTDPARVQTFRIALPQQQLETDDVMVARMLQEIAQRVGEVPGVATVGISSSITMDGEDNTNPLYVEDRPAAGPLLTPFRRFKNVAPDYFAAMGNDLVAGRSLTWDDTFARRDVVVISEALAREYWKEPAAALGRRVRATFDDAGAWHEVVGVVGNERDDGLTQPPTSIVYWPLLSSAYPAETAAFAVRSDRVGRPGFLEELQQAVWSVNPQLPLAHVQTVDAIVQNTMAQTTFVMVMLSVAAAVTLCLGVIGIYAVLSYSASQRTREIGIRAAIGAQPSDLRRLFLLDGLRLTAAGLAVGICWAILLTRTMSTMIHGVPALDAATYIVASVVVAATAAMAAYLPSRRACRVDPLVVLRGDA